MNEQTLRDWYARCPDVKFENYISDVTGIRALLIYCEGLCHQVKISELVLPELQMLTPEKVRTYPEKAAIGQCLMARMAPPWTEAQVSGQLFGGFLLVYFPDQMTLLQFELLQAPRRLPDESNMENSTRGPKDGFTEELDMNIALIRKRIRTSDLCYEEIEVGRQKQTRVALMYMRNIENRPYLQEAKKRLQDIDMQYLNSIMQLEDRLTDAPFSLFPLITYTGRPDFAVDCLLHDRFIIIMDANPSVLIAPANLLLLLKSAEDMYLSYAIGILSRLIRLVSLLVTIFLPGFWISLIVYNQDQLPFPLLATITVTRLGLPLSSSLEMLLSLVLLEMFREAGNRLPKSIGQTITVVGGLIIGEAAIRAGLISPSVIVVSALTAVATSTLINLNLSGNVVLLRLFVFGISSVLGMFGCIVSLIFIVGHLAKLRSFGIPYLAPVSPVTWRDIVNALIKLPDKEAGKHPRFLKKD